MAKQAGERKVIKRRLGGRFNNENNRRINLK